MAFLKPISRVLSETVTNIIFMMPIPPTIREMAAMPVRAMVKTLMILLIDSNPF